MKNRIPLWVPLACFLLSFLGILGIARGQGGGYSGGGSYTSCAPCNPWYLTSTDWQIRDGATTRFTFSRAGVFTIPTTGNATIGEFIIGHTTGTRIAWTGDTGNVWIDPGATGWVFEFPNGGTISFQDGSSQNMATVHDEGTTGSISTSSQRFRNSADATDYIAIGQSADQFEVVINGTQEFTVGPTAVTIPGANLVMVGNAQIDALNPLDMRTAAGTAVAEWKTTRDSTGGTGLELELEAGATGYDVDVAGTCQNWYDGATLLGGICGGASDRFFLDDGTDARFGTTGNLIAGIYAGSETEGGSLGTFTAHTCTQVADIAVGGTVDSQSPCFVGASPYGSGWNKICDIRCGVDNTDNTSVLVNVCVTSATNTDCDGSNTMTWQVAVFNFD